MLPYAALVIILPLGYCFPKRKRISTFFLIWFIIAIALFALHGDFTADYGSYQTFFRQYSYYSWDDIKGILSLDYHFNVLEVGYAMLNFLISRFTDNYLYMQLCQAVIICIPVMIYLKKSNMPLLSLALYLSIGTYLESYNTVRGFMAASICICAFQYITQQNLKKYIITVLVASLFHLSALVLLPFYFVLRLKPSFSTVLKYSIATIVGVIFIDNIAVLYNAIFKVTNSSLAELLYRSQNDVKLVIFPVCMALISLILFIRNRKFIKDQLSPEETVLFNGTVVWTILKLLTMVSGYSTRFAGYFACFMWLFFPYVIGRRFSKRTKVILVPCFIVVCVIYYLIQTRSYGDYFSLF